MRQQGSRVFRSIGALILAAMMVTVAACGTTKPVSQKEDLTVARTASVTSLNLWTQVTANNAFAIDKLFDTLVTFNDKGNIVDELASSHKVSKDGLTYTFTLRNNLQFSDGTPIEAKDVVFSLKEHIKHNNSPVPLSAPIKTIKAVNPREVRIELKTPFAPLLAELSGFSNGIVPSDFDGKSEQDFFKQPISSGPFVVSHWDPSADLTFTVNNHYWSQKPTFKTLKYKLVENGAQALNQLKTGQVDVIEDPDFDNLSSLQKDGNINVLTGGSWKVEQVFFNTLDSHFKDIHVRRAFAMAIDKAAISKAVAFGYATPITTIVPPTLAFNGNGEAPMQSEEENTNIVGSPAGSTSTNTDSKDDAQAPTSGVSQAVTPLPHNLQKAKQELAKSAFPHGFTAHILVPSSNEARVRIAQILQAEVQPLGIQLVIDQVDMATFRAKFRRYNYEIMINTAQADYPDANSMVDFEANPDGFSKAFWTHYRNEHVASMIAKARTAVTAEERGKIYHNIEQILVEDAPYVPLYMVDNVKAVRANVHGLELLPNGSVRYHNVRF